MTKKAELSKCHQAEMYVRLDDEGTNHFVCGKCWQPCDPIDSSAQQAEPDKQCAEKDCPNEHIFGSIWCRTHREEAWKSTASSAIELPPDSIHYPKGKNPSPSEGLLRAAAPPSPLPVSKELDGWVCRLGHVGQAIRKNATANQCRICKQATDRASYERHKAQRRAVKDAYKKTHWEQIKKASYLRRDPFKHRARQAVNNAVRMGKFERADCQHCSSPKTQFHHTDGYDEANWFTGIWLCSQCHALEHKKLRNHV